MCVFTVVWWCSEWINKLARNKKSFEISVVTKTHYQDNSKKLTMTEYHYLIKRQI